MLSHLLYARAALGYEKPDMNAHAKFSCQVSELGGRIAHYYQSAMMRLGSSSRNQG